MADTSDTSSDGQRIQMRATFERIASNRCHTIGEEQFQERMTTAKGHVANGYDTLGHCQRYYIVIIGKSPLPNRGHRIGFPVCLDDRRNDDVLCCIVSIANDLCLLSQHIKRIFDAATYYFLKSLIRHGNDIFILDITPIWLVRFLIIFYKVGRDMQSQHSPVGVIWGAKVVGRCLWYLSGTNIKMF